MNILRISRFRAASAIFLFWTATAPVRADINLRPSGEHGVRITIADKESDLRLNPALVDQSLPEPTLRVKSGEARTKEKVGQLLVSVSAGPSVIKVEDATGRLIQELQFSDSDGTISFPLGDAPVLGLGEGADQFDRRGFNYPLRNGQSDRTATLGTRIYSPFLLGTGSWALLVATPSGSFDLRGPRGIFTPRDAANSSFADVFVIDAKNPADAMREFSRLTGAAAMPPKWALGYMQSHRTLSTEADLLAEARTFREEKLPCDAMIYLGTGFCPRGWNVAHDSFQFNSKVFEREAADVIKDLHVQHLHVVLHIVPLQKDYPTLHGNVPAGADETSDVQQISAYWKRHQSLFAAGIDGWWPDEGDWLDVPSRLARHRMYYEGPLSDRPNVRPWDLQRNGYPGIARTGGWYWSGDVMSTWKTLAEHVKVGLNASLSVSPFWGTDIGGFYPAPTKEFTGELYVRWFQYATFCPLFRSHGRTWKLHTPIGWNTGETGPVESQPPPDPSELHNAEVEPICRDYLNLRYQLMPYTYTITRETHDTGIPLMRALWLHYPTDAEAVKRGDEYLWGRDMLVAPVVERGATSREVYLPAGDWYDWWTTEKNTGGRTVSRNVDLKTLPLYVRAGAIIPFDPIRQYVDEPVTEPTTIRIYRGADGEFTLYDDDGNSQEYLQSEGMRTRFVWHDAQRKLSVDATSKGAFPAREFNVVLLPENVNKKLTFSGPSVDVNF